MAKGIKTGGRDFKPGQSGNPKGKQRLSKDEKDIREMTRSAFEAACQAFLNLSKEQIVKKLQDPSTTGMEMMVGRVIQQAIVIGDQNRLDFVLNRLVGKVKDKIEHSGPGGETLKIVLEDYTTGGQSGDKVGKKSKTKKPIKY